MIKKKARGALDVALIFNYRILTGLLSYWFKYPANPAVAQQTYANLSNKFLIKQLGSWGDVLEFRSKEMVSKQGIHYDKFIKFDDDDVTVKVVNDSQGRIKDLLKNIYAEFMRVIERGDRITTTSLAMVDVEGVGVLKDKTHGVDGYTTYILSIMHDKNSFIKKELVDVITQLMFTTSEKSFMATLVWISENSNHTRDAELEKLVRLTMVHSYDFLMSDSTYMHDTKDLPGFLSRIRGVYLSSRSTDKNLMEMRKIGYKLVKKAGGANGENAIASIRTSLFLYIVLRAYTKHYYTH